MNKPTNPESLTLVKKALLAVEEMKAKLAQVEEKQREPIAIISMACRFPGSSNTPEQFWELLRDGKSGVTEVPAERWHMPDFYDPNPDAPGKSYARYGAFIDEIDQFDAPFFNIAPVEANKMDPQQRLLLELSWEALERAGISPTSLRGGKVGVFVGMTTLDYLRLTLGNGDKNEIDALVGIGVSYCIAAGRLSYFFGFQGGNFPIDTACSSSLVAVHQACQSLRMGECEMALAGGVNAMLVPDAHIYFAKTRALSPNPACRTFDAGADGYVRGEGCGMILLKRLSDALADGDPIEAVIRGSAINHDGRSSGLTAPNGPAQQAVIRTALANGNISPHQVSYLEAHGTGTPLGDPIEVQAMSAVLGNGRLDENPLVIGSVKTNVGHLEGAAGIAGLIKTVLMLKNRQLAPHLHFKTPNPYIAWDELPVKVNTQLRDWQVADGATRIAGISSFGFSGTNAHVVLAEAPSQQKRPNRKMPAQLLLLSAKSELSLRQLAKRYAHHLSNHEEQSLADVCGTAMHGRTHFPYRLAIVGDSHQQMAEQLNRVEEDAGTFPRTSAKPPSLIFQFTGQGSQFAGMGDSLYEYEPIFRQNIDTCAEHLRPYLPMPLTDYLFSNSQTDIHQTQFTQPALFAFEYALAQLWLSWGVQPAGLIGHSIGEYVAATLAGVFSLADGLALVAKRGELMGSLPQNGTMLATFASEAEVAEQIAGIPQISIAVVNGADNVVIAGIEAGIQQAQTKLEDAGMITRPLRVSHAFHSPLMTPILEQFRAFAGKFSYASPQTPLISNVTGQFFADSAVPDADYWTEHIRATVRYYAGIQACFSAKHTHFWKLGQSRFCQN